MSLQCLTLYGDALTNSLRKGTGVMHVAVELHLDANRTDAGEERDGCSVWEKLCEDRKDKYNFAMWNWEGILPKRMGLFKIYEYYQTNAKRERHRVRVCMESWWAFSGKKEKKLTSGEVIGPGFRITSVVTDKYTLISWRKEKGMLLHFHYDDFQNLVKQPKPFAYMSLSDVESLQRYSPVTRAVPFWAVLSTKR